MIIGRQRSQTNYCQKTAKQMHSPKCDDPHRDYICKDSIQILQVFIFSLLCWNFLVLLAQMNMEGKLQNGLLPRNAQVIAIVII